MKTETETKIELKPYGTLIVRVPEEMLVRTERVILDGGFWCKTFYEEDASKERKVIE